MAASVLKTKKCHQAAAKTERNGINVFANVDALRRNQNAKTDRFIMIRLVPVDAELTNLHAKAIKFITGINVNANVHIICSNLIMAVDTKHGFHNSVNAIVFLVNQPVVVLALRDGAMINVNANVQILNQPNAMEIKSTTRINVPAHVQSRKSAKLHLPGIHLNATAYVQILTNVINPRYWMQDVTAFAIMHQHAVPNKFSTINVNANVQ